MLIRNTNTATAAAARITAAILSFSFCRFGKGEALAKSAGFALISAERLDFVRFRQGLRLAGCVRFETRLDFPETNPVADAQKSIGDEVAVHPRAVRGAEIFQLISLVDQEQFRVPAGDRRVVDLEHVIGAASDRDPLLGQFVRGAGVFQERRKVSAWRSSIRRANGEQELPEITSS